MADNGPEETGPEATSEGAAPEAHPDLVRPLTDAVAQSPYGGA